jgi:hypothetical protein
LTYFLTITNEEKFEKMPWSKESPFEKMEREFRDRGFTLAGQESLTKFQFTKDARFVAVPFRTKQEIAQEYIARYKDRVDIEVELVDVEGLNENQKAVYVFIRPKK